MISKNIKPLYLILISLLLIIGKAFAQDHPNYMYVPKALNKYVKASFIEDIYNNNVSLVSLTEKANSTRFWTVYSDRANNTLYTKGGWEKENERPLKLMERVVVKDIKERDGNTWLHVYSKSYKEMGKNPKNHVERGWIKAENVLLSNFALLNNQGIPKKRLMLYSLGEPNEEIQKEHYYYYNQPEVGAKGDENVARKFRIFYVLKKEPGWVLLSKTDKLEGSNEIGDILGWVPRRYTTAWDHRVCYEPASNREAYNTYKNKDLPIFSRKRTLNQFIETGKLQETEVFKTFHVKSERPRPYIMRMPIMNNIGANKKKVVTIQSINEMTNEEEAKIDKKINTLENKQELVNILLVVDATESMSKYLPQIKESITEIIRNNNISDANTSLRFGLAVYRDYPDDSDDFNLVPLTEDHDKVINKLLQTDTHSKDKDLPEAQYQGLVKGIRKAGFNKDNSNVVVLVGDAGNHTNDPEGYTSDKVINALQEYNASMIAFQVINGKAPSYDTFNFDVMNYLTKSAEEYGGVELRETGNKNTYKLVYPGLSEEERSLLRFGRFTYASGDQNIMEPSILKDNITRLVSDYLFTVEKGITILKNMREGNVQGDMNPEMVKWLKDHDFSEEQIGKLQNLGEFTKRGYISKKYYNNDVKAFSPVVFLSSNEKRKIDNTLRKLTKGKMSITERKKALQNTLLEQCKKILGEVSDRQIYDKNMNEIWQIILSIPFTGSSKIKNTLLRNIKSISDKKFRPFYDGFEEAANEFITNDYRNSRFELANQTYYWIPLKDIPGNA